MNQVTQEQKDAVTKTLAIVGFIAAILFAVWLAVQVVSVIPSAFSSLASIADGVYKYNDDVPLTVVTKNSVVNTGEAFTLTWTQMPRPGTYSFSYECTEGASIDIRDAQNNVVGLNCATPLSLGSQTTLDIIVTSEKQRFTDITYSVAYRPNDTSREMLTSNSQITIVNASIPTRAVATDEPAEGTVAGESTSEPEAVPQSPNTGLVAGTPTTIETLIYAIPVSDPNGTVDLAVTYLGVGELEGKTFIPGGTIDKDAQGAFQFSVQNIGTKTSKDWTYEALLPSGIEYASKVQDVLKPNEKAIITIGFEGLTQVGIERFGATVTTSTDVNTNNNNFTWAVEVVN